MRGRFTESDLPLGRRLINQLDGRDGGMSGYKAKKAKRRQWNGVPGVGVESSKCKSTYSWQGNVAYTHPALSPGSGQADCSSHGTLNKC